MSNVELTDRKEKILQILKTHRLLTIDQLEYLHPDFGKQSQSQLLLRRDINKLSEFYFIDKATRKPAKQWDNSTKKTIILALGEVGSEFVGWKHYKRIRYENGKAILPKTTHHILRIHDMEIQTRELLNQMNVEVKLWVYECGNQIVAHENRLNPDAFCLMQDKTNGKYYTAFFEYDTGKMDFRKRTKFPELAKKFGKYQEVQGWKPWDENKFPHLFFVTEAQSRFPGVPDLLKEKGIKNTVCMQNEFELYLKEFIQNMRKQNA